MPGEREKLDRFRRMKELQSRAGGAEVPPITPDQSGEDKPGFFSNLAQGTGVGLANVGRGVTNLLTEWDPLEDSIRPDWATDEHIAAKKKENKELMSTGGGMVGGILGETLATLPLGAVGWGARGGLAGWRAAQAAKAAGKVGGAVKTARTAARAASTGKTLVTRTLAHPASVGAVEGGLAGAAVAEPGNRGFGAGVGSVFGGTLGAAGRGLKKLSKGGFVEETDAGKAFLSGRYTVGGRSSVSDPGLAMTAKPGFWRMLYNAGIANIPFAGAKIRVQFDKSLQSSELAIADHLFPLAGKFSEKTLKEMGNLLPRAGQNLDEIMQNSAKYFKDFAYRAITKKKFQLTPGGIPGLKPGALQDVLEKYNPDSKFFKFGTRKVATWVDGDEIWATRNYLRQIADEVDAERFAPTGKYAPGKEMREMADAIDVWIGKQSKTAKSAIKFNSEPYQNFKTLLKVRSSKREIPGGSVGSAARQRSGEAGALGQGGRMESLGWSQKDVLQDFPSRQGLFQTLAATGAAAGILTGFGIPTLLGMGIGITLARGMAKPGFQRWLAGRVAGNTKLTKNLTKEALEGFYAKYQRELAVTGLAGRQAVATTAGGQ